MKRFNFYIYVYGVLVLAGWGVLTLPPADAAQNRQLSLDEAIQIAQEHNPMGRKALEDITGAQFTEKSAKSGYMPNLSVNYAITQMADHVYQVQNGKNVQVAHDTQYGWGVAVVQPLFTGFAVSCQHEIAQIGVEVSKKEKEQVFLDLTRGVKAAYYHLLLADKILLTADEAVTTLQSHEDDAQRFYKYGIIRQNDLLRAKVALSDALQQRERSRADVDTARAELNRWLARDINADTQVEQVDSIGLIHSTLSDLMASGLAQRPQLQAMTLVSESLEKAVKLEKSSYYPTVSLVGRYWQNGDSPIADNNDYENDHNASLSLQASWQLFDGFKTRSDVGKAVSAKRSYDQTIRQVQDQICVEIKRAWLNLGVAQHNVKASKVTLAQAQENMRITQLAYRQEAATSTEVLDAQTDLTGARTNYYQALYGYLDALAALEHAVGHTLESEMSTEALTMQ